MASQLIARAGRAFGPVREARGVPRWIVWAGIVLTLLFVVMALAAPWIAPYEFDQYKDASGQRFVKQQAPSSAHWFGTNVQSTDVMSRVIWGARTELKVVLFAVVVSLLVGLPLGLLSGYFGGPVDRVLVLIMDALFAFPYLLLAIVIAFLLSDKFGSGVATAAFAISAVYIPQYFRVVRNHVVSLREESYVEAARALGARPRTVIGRHTQCRGCDPDLGRARVPRLWHPAHRRRRVGLRQLPRAVRRRRWYLVDGPVPGHGDRVAGDRSDAAGRGPERCPQPGAAAAQDGARHLAATRTAGGRGMSATAPVLDVRDLRVWYGSARGAVRAVDGVSLQIRAGEVLGLVGESGCGKSTLGRGVMGLLPDGSAVDGQVLFQDTDLLKVSDRQLRRMRGPDIALIFQEPMTRLNPLMRIEDHFSESITAHEPKLSKAEVRRRSLEALGGMGIPPTRFRNYPHEFSGGMRQRIMIALALVLRPKLVIADEPTTALDVLVEAQILSILADLKRNFDTALLLITHNLGIVAEACDRVAVMYAGRIAEEGDARTVFSQPAHPYTRELLRSVISLNTTGLHYIPGAPPSLIDPPAACKFHPRCPDAMRVCAQLAPVEQRLSAGQRVECWLHGPSDRIPEGGREPLEQGRIAVAEEA
jgi:peptide/nickel transport system ATP-binding protein